MHEVILPFRVWRTITCDKLEIVVCTNFDPMHEVILPFSVWRTITSDKLEIVVLRHSKIDRDMN